MDFVAHIVKYNGSTSGRDKLCRLFQYASRYALWHATNRNHQDLMNKMKILEKALSSARKVFRFGKSLDMIQGAIKNLDVKDPVLRLTLILAKLNQACYLLLDHYIWLTKIGLLESDTKVLGPIAARFWLVTLFFNLMRNAHDIINIVRHERTQGKAAESKKTDGVMDSALRSEGPRNSQNANLGHLLISNKHVVLDTVKNLTDLVLPSSVLYFPDMSVGFQSVMGMISSLCGILVTWYPELRLVPS